MKLELLTFSHQEHKNTYEWNRTKTNNLQVFIGRKFTFSLPQLWPKKSQLLSSSTETNKCEERHFLNNDIMISSDIGLQHKTDVLEKVYKKISKFTRNTLSFSTWLVINDYNRMLWLLFTFYCNYCISSSWKSLLWDILICQNWNISFT